MTLRTWIGVMAASAAIAAPATQVPPESTRTPPEAPASAPKDTIFTSPKGRFSVSFSPLLSRADTAAAAGEANSLKLSILFRPQHRDTAIRAEYFDVYGIAPEDKPTPYAEIFARITWSPNEDFAILPEENWERPPGPPTRKAVNLTRSRTWKEASLRFQPLEWITRHKIAGEFQEDCEHSVIAFDGRNGRTFKILEGNAGTAYTIRARKHPNLVLERQLGPCPDSLAQAGFKPGCIYYNVLNKKARQGKCPRS